MAQRQKRSVSLPADLAHAIDLTATAEGTTVSAWIADTAAHRLRIDAGRQGVVEWERHHGVLTASSRRPHAGRARPRPSDAPPPTFPQERLNERRHLRHRRTYRGRPQRPTHVGTARRLPRARGFPHRPDPGARRSTARRVTPSLARFLALCTTEPLTEEQAKAVGAVAARAGHDDIVDATVVQGAVRRHDAVATSKPTHIRKIADATRSRLTIETV